MGVKATITGVGQALPASVFEQSEVVRKTVPSESFRERLIDRVGIDYRPLGLDGNLEAFVEGESQEARRRRHEEWGIRLGAGAVRTAVRAGSADVTTAGHLVAVTSTGLLCPGLSFGIAAKTGMRSDAHLLDVVGMGCTGGLAALRSATQLVQRENSTAFVVCAEINSAMHYIDENRETAVVNSLFSDGAACVVVRPASANNSTEACAHVIGFDAQVWSEWSHTMRFEWDARADTLRFRLTKQVPILVGRVIGPFVHRMLSRHGIEFASVKHWVVHGGGPALVRAVARGIGLDPKVLAHSTSVLRDFGNLSSGSVFFSLKRLLEASSSQGELGVMIAMGPGLRIDGCVFELG